MSRQQLWAHRSGDCGWPCIYCDREEAHEAVLDSSEQEREDEGLPDSQADEGP